MSLIWGVLCYSRRACVEGGIDWPEDHSSPWLPSVRTSFLLEGLVDLILDFLEGW